MLKRYAQAHGVNPAGWAFLGDSGADPAGGPALWHRLQKDAPRSDVDHTFLTSLIDHSGTLRVQYLGTRFDLRSCCAVYWALVREDPVMTW